MKAMMLALLAILPAVWAAPFAHDVNDFALDGSVCTPIPFASDCPVLCTKNLALCPGSTGSCAGNETLCLDGKCYEDDKCLDTKGKDISNACDCGKNGKIPRADHGQVACRVISGSYLSETGGDTFCNAGYTVDTAELDPTVVEVLNCEAVPLPDGSETFFVVIYAVWGGFAFLNFLWWMARRNTQSSFPPDGPDPDELMKGYSDSIFGTFLFVVYVLLTLSWMGIFAWICTEYYITFGAFFSYSYVAIDRMLICTWHVSSMWFAFTKFIGGNLRNYYRTRVPLQTATYVGIWKRTENQILLADESHTTKLVRRMNAIMIQIMGVPGRYVTCTVATSSASTRYFDYRCMRFSFVTDSGMKADGGLFISAKSEVPATNDELLKLRKGLSPAARAAELEKTGENFIRVIVPGVLGSIFNEFTSFFYIYQFMIIWVFFYWSYWIMGFIHSSVITIAGMIKVFLKRSSELKIKSMAESKSQCHVLRDGEWKIVNSLSLVPLDVVGVQADMVVPADMVLITGNAILDEAMLTGEAMPVQKFSLSNTQNVYEKMKGGKKNTMFAGTKVLDTQVAMGEETVLALVVAVGAHTEKGQLVSGILYAPPASFVFDEHLKLVFAMILSWGAVALIIVANIAGTATTTTWLYAIFIISQVLPPLLPAVLVIGQSSSAARLLTQNIFCVDLNRITMAGKVKTFCFDKTGTLTTEGLDFHGLLPVVGAEFQPMADSSALPPLLSQAIGCTHTVSKLVTTTGERLVGNPVDVEMFTRSKWQMEAHDDGAVYTKDGKTIKVLKQHEFCHDRMSMAVVVMIDKEVHVFVKGSFEAIGRLSRPESLPPTYHEEAQRVAANGCYTLGIAHRCLGPMSAEEARALPREKCEEGADCVSLLMFRNNLKEDTPAAIAALHEGSVRTVMITGDTATTGVYIARKCGMVPAGTTVLLGELRKSNSSSSDGEQKEEEPRVNDIVWSIVDQATGNLTGTVSMQDILGNVAEDIVDIEIGDDVNEKNESVALTTHKRYELAMTGATFNVLMAEGETLRQVLPICRVFARMTPVDKVRCVQLHMETDITAMCGDGGNDCGALRAAHVGIAMSEGEASIVSPFSTSDKSVFAAVTVLREGRCCLSTSFYTFDFVLMYGETIVLSKLFYLYFSCQLAEKVWIFFEGMLVPLLSFTLAQARPKATLVPRRPTARLLGLETIASVVGILIINFLFMIGAYVMLYNQDFFLCNEWDASKVDLSKWWLLADNYEGETIGLLVMNQVLNAAVVGNFAAGYRQDWVYNWSFILVYVTGFTILSCLLLLDPNPLGCWFRFNCGDPEVLVAEGYLTTAEGVDWTGPKYNNISGHNVFPLYFRWTLWVYCLGNLLTVVVYIRVIIIGRVRTYLRVNHGRKPKVVKSLKA